MRKKDKERYFQKDMPYSTQQMEHRLQDVAKAEREAGSTTKFTMFKRLKNTNEKLLFWRSTGVFIDYV